ncbi:hypothetical protein ACN38_g11691 [Penicillium nordicum]|uniref:Uncharacterized protein n=1 Tax=Penicillium nordicum TaxID=229535 RepID=A0A0N0RXJ2_9EURO|nr:hypothetical protein ACN38_g11691 [Penicillium nordicum]
MRSWHTSANPLTSTSNVSNDVTLQFGELQKEEIVKRSLGILLFKNHILQVSSFIDFRSNHISQGKTGTRQSSGPLNKQ